MRRKSFIRLIAVIALVVLLLIWTACGSGSGPSRGTSNPSTGATVQLTIGDGPGDRVAALAITINSVTLTPSSGSAVNLLTSPITVEVTHLAGTTTPLTTITVPTGTYTQATITLGGATITIVDPATGQATQKSLPAPQPVTVTLSPALVVSGSPLALNLDLNLAASIAFDTAGNVTFNPHFLETHGPITGSGVTPNPFAGGVEFMLGMVDSVSTTTFTIVTPDQQKFTFTTNNSTIFANVSGMSGLSKGMLVIVSAQTQSDGTLVAVRVSGINMMTNSMGAVGIVARVNSPLTQFLLLVKGVMFGPVLPAGTPNPIGAVLGVNVNSGTVFRANTDGVGMTGLSFNFDANSLSPVQFVSVDTAGGLTFGGSTTGSTLPFLGTLNATQVELHQQPVAGTVSNYTGGSTFTLTVPSDSAFAVLAKTTTVTVYKQSTTTLMDNLTLTNGQVVVVRGLLFAGGGTYNLVATRIRLQPAS